jgi:hypothetical protein
MAAVVFTSSGCLIVAPFETRPPMSGQLVSAPDGRAVAGANVVVDTYVWDRQKVSSMATRTDAAGLWSGFHGSRGRRSDARAAVSQSRRGRATLPAVGRGV